MFTCFNIKSKNYVRTCTNIFVHLYVFCLFAIIINLFALCRSCDNKNNIIIFIIMANIITITNDKFY